MEESIRAANTSPRLVRTTTTNTQVLGYPIPKGTSLLLNPYIGTKPLDIPEGLRSETSRGSKDNFESYWDPSGMTDFEPERWLAEDGSFNPRQFPRLAFSAGPRMCYGMFHSMSSFNCPFYATVSRWVRKHLTDNEGISRQKSCIDGVPYESCTPGLEFQVRAPPKRFGQHGISATAFPNAKTMLCQAHYVDSPLPFGRSNLDQRDDLT